LIAVSNCNCLICRLETNLIAELSAEGHSAQYRKLIDSSLVLSGFPTPVQLVQYLHRPDAENQHSSSDDILLELLRPRIDPLTRQLWHCLLLLVFIPTIHRTASQLSAIFPSLARDDTAQHLITVLLDFLHSKELQSRQSHFAFTIARGIRRAAFRWAIHESRVAAIEEPDGPPTMLRSLDVSGDPSHAAVLLRQFLDDCERQGWLTSNERQILTESKIAGLSCRELSRRNGHSAVAIQHRIHRLIDRLRRLAQKPSNSIPQQLKLFTK
jgi:DNA-directed RNA polymerase specialized sigma24 family protein